MSIGTEAFGAPIAPGQSSLCSSTCGGIDSDIGSVELGQLCMIYMPLSELHLGGIYSCLESVLGKLTSWKILEIM